MISQDQIQQVRDRSDIVDTIRSYVDLKKAGASLKGLCPFHNEKSPSFHVNPRHQYYHCFGCGASGSVIDFIMQIEGMEFLPALRLLADRAGIILTDSSSPEDIKKARIIKQGKERLYELMQSLSLWYGSQLHTREAEIARQYIQSRGLDDETIRRFGIGYSPDSWDATCKWGLSKGYSRQDMLDAGLLIVNEGKTLNDGYDRFRGRLMFPIWDDTGRVVGFSARTLKDEPAKYINSPETLIFNKSNVLYAFPHAKNGFRTHDFAILCEGQLDVISCHRAGFNNAVAPQGTAFTAEQARLLKRFVNHVAVAFDADNAGKKAADRSFEELFKAGIEMSVITMPEGEDPDGIFKKGGREALANYFNERKDYFDYRISSFNEQQFESAADKSEVAQSIIAKAAMIPDTIARSFIIQKLSSLNIPEQAIRKSLQEIQRKNRNQQHGENRPENRHNIASLHLTKEEKARINLIDLSIHHGFIAHKLMHELPESVFAADAYGQILGEVVGLTFQGEWKHAGRILTEHHHGRLPQQVMQAIVKSDFAAFDTEDEAKRKTLEKMADDCIRTLIITDLEQQEKIVWQNYKQADDADKKRSFMQQASVILQKKTAYLKKIKSEQDKK